KRSSVDLNNHFGIPTTGLLHNHHALPDGIREDGGINGGSSPPAPLYVIYDEPNNAVGVKRNSFRDSYTPSREEA
ncbi:hypothetical protein SK128_018210, partial [Halocaridina rubra]